MEKEQVLSGHLIQRSSRLLLMDHDIFLTHTQPCRQPALPILLHRLKSSCCQPGARGTRPPCPAVVAHSHRLCTYNKKKYLWVQFTPPLTAIPERSATRQTQCDSGSIQTAAPSSTTPVNTSRSARPKSCARRCRRRLPRCPGSGWGCCSASLTSAAGQRGSLGLCRAPRGSRQPLPS